MPKTANPRLKRALWWALGLSVLAAVFCAYLRPDMALLLANQLWNCF